MEQKIENKLEIKSKLLKFFNRNKTSILILLIIFFVMISSFIYMDNYNKKKNKLISEKFIQAKLNLSSDKKRNAKLILEEIVLSKNDIYSILALNLIVEKNLITEKNQIIKYFKILEETTSAKDENDLIKFKKALYLIKNSDTEKGENIMKNLIDQNSNLKPIIKELLEK